MEHKLTKHLETLLGGVLNVAGHINSYGSSRAICLVIIWYKVSIIAW
jgi:hypothetical protein